MQIQILPANPRWPLAFARVKAELMPALPAGAQVHHIGSTAVPGLATKDIIDVQVTVARLADIDDTALTVAGFLCRRATTDHCPPGMTLPAPDLAKCLYASDHPHRAHIHFREQGRFNQRYPLLCRDYLRSHPLAAAACAAVKHHLVAHFPGDPDAYYAIKDPVFDLIMTGAEAWAQTSRWTAPSSD